MLTLHILIFYRKDNDWSFRTLISYPNPPSEALSIIFLFVLIKTHFPCTLWNRTTGELSQSHRYCYEHSPVLLFPSLASLHITEQGFRFINIESFFRIFCINNLLTHLFLGYFQRWIFESQTFLKYRLLVWKPCKSEPKMQWSTCLHP